MHLWTVIFIFGVNSQPHHLHPHEMLTESPQNAKTSANIEENFSKSKAKSSFLKLWTWLITFN